MHVISKQYGSWSSPFVFSTTQVRELHIRSELLPLETSAEDLRKGGFRGVIISGGPNSVYAEDAPKVHEDLFDAGMPVWVQIKCLIAWWHLFFFYYCGYKLSDGRTNFLRSERTLPWRSGMTKLQSNLFLVSSSRHPGSGHLLWHAADEPALWGHRRAEGLA